MSSGLNLQVVKGTTATQLKEVLNYKENLKTDEEIQGIRSVTAWEPVLISMELGPSSESTESTPST